MLQHDTGVATTKSQIRYQPGAGSQQFLVIHALFEPLVQCKPVISNGASDCTQLCLIPRFGLSSSVDGLYSWNDWHGQVEVCRAVRILLALIRRVPGLVRPLQALLTPPGPVLGVI